MKCVEDVKVNSTSCLPPCSGLFVTSFSKFKPEEKLVAVFPEAENYNKYKKITQHPEGFSSKNIETKIFFVKLKQGSGKDRQGMVIKS